MSSQNQVGITQASFFICTDIP